MLKKILNNKLYLCITIAIAVLFVASVVVIIVCTSCGGNDIAEDNSAQTSEDTPLLGFETVYDSQRETYPVTYISTSDFYELLNEDRCFSVGERFENELVPCNAELYHVIEVNITSGTDVTSESDSNAVYVSSSSGMYLEKGNNVYYINYNDCQFYTFDIDGDGENETIFYTCEVGTDRTNQVCTYFILGEDDDDISWCRYKRAWAVGSSTTALSGTDADVSQIQSAADNGEIFVVSLMVSGINNEVYGQLVCDNSGEKPYYYIDAGEYTELLQRIDGLDE